MAKLATTTSPGSGGDRHTGYCAGRVEAGWCRTARAGVRYQPAAPGTAGRMARMFKACVELSMVALRAARWGIASLQGGRMHVNCCRTLTADTRGRAGATGSGQGTGGFRRVIEYDGRTGPAVSSSGRLLAGGACVRAAGLAASLAWLSGCPTARRPRGFTGNLTQSHSRARTVFVSLACSSRASRLRPRLGPDCDVPQPATVMSRGLASARPCSKSACHGQPSTGAATLFDGATSKCLPLFPFAEVCLGAVKGGETPVQGCKHQEEGRERKAR